MQSICGLWPIDHEPENQIKDFEIDVIEQHERQRDVVMSGEEGNESSAMSQLNTFLEKEKSIIANWLHVHESSVFTICRETWDIVDSLSIQNEEATSIPGCPFQKANKWLTSAARHVSFGTACWDKAPSRSWLETRRDAYLV